LGSRLYKSVELKKGYMPIVTPKNSELKYIEFGRLFLPEKGDEYKSETVKRLFRKAHHGLPAHKCGIQSYS